MPSLIALAKARLDKIEGRSSGPRMRLRDFVQESWRFVEPTKLVWERHMDEVCTHLEAVFFSQRPELAESLFEEWGLDRAELCTDLRQLIINVPPGTSKSLLCCVFFQAWVWSIDQSLKFIYVSYSDRLSLKASNLCRTLMESEWYTTRWGDLRGVTWSSSFYINKHGGWRLSTTVGGGATGNHADIQIVDDPIKPLDTQGGAAATKLAMTSCIDWWTGTMPTRMVNAERSARVIIMQRLHMLDLAGEMIKTGDYDHLRLPMEYEAAHPCVTRVGGDWRTQQGELLAPKRFGPNAIIRLKKNLRSEINIAAQLQQRPVPASGGIFKITWFTRTDRRYTTAPLNFDIVIQSWDMRFKDDKETGDYVVGQVWGVCRTGFYLLHQVRGRWSFNETVEQFKLVSAIYPEAHLKLVENAANGPAVANSLETQIMGIVLVSPDGGKISRANVAAAAFEAGNVWLPEEASWLPEFIEEFSLFPKGLHDDQVDSASQALSRLSTSLGRFEYETTDEGSEAEDLAAAV